ncbi:putative B3 domain-containing protein At5g66980 [Rhododendron vialii]|uniref:putative B3 domain-containing protein At5g66980 n=1 Tax=Rhododendron vialii TaxID=182163 RepID=UPI00265F7EE2|nr:putative B3 domain-containing protein At5g66980 [Rhododendron vialii]
MGRKPKHFPSFSKVLMDDFASKLRIPPEFVMRDLDGKLPAKALIKDRNYSHWWTVKVKTTGEENHYSFTQSGWRKLVRDCELKEMDFMVFTLVSNSVFEVVRYAPNGCEKDLISNPIIGLQDSEQIKENSAVAPKTRSRKSKEADALPHPSTRRRSRGKVAAEAFGSREQTEHPSFTVVITKYYRSRLTLQKSFARETSMATKKSVKLRNEEGKEWTVDICVRTHRTSYGRIDLGVGWPAFCKENEIVDGDSCLFKFIKSAGDVIDVVVHKGGRG